MAKKEAPVEVSFGHVLGACLSRRRKLASLLQEHVASAVGVSTSTWSRIENGMLHMTVVHLRKAASAMGTTSWEIFQEADNVCRHVDAKKFNVKIVDARSPDQRSSNALVVALAATIVAHFWGPCQ